MKIIGPNGTKKVDGRAYFKQVHETVTLGPRRGKIQDNIIVVSGGGPMKHAVAFRKSRKARNTDPTGAMRTRLSVAPQRCHGDLINEEGIPFMYQTGHGGRGWAINSTVF